jgi:hypothetical protein
LATLLLPKMYFLKMAGVRYLEMAEELWERPSLGEDLGVFERKGSWEIVGLHRHWEVPYTWQHKKMKPRSWPQHYPGCWLAPVLGADSAFYTLAFCHLCPFLLSSWPYYIFLLCLPCSVQSWEREAEISAKVPHKKLPT